MCVHMDGCGWICTHVAGYVRRCDPMSPFALVCEGGLYPPWVWAGRMYVCQDIRTTWLTRWACMRTRTRRPWIGWVCAWFCLGFSGMCMDVPRMCRRAEGSASDLSNVAAALMFALVFAVARSSPVSSPHLPSLGLGRACDLQRCGVCAGASMFSEDLGTFFLAGQSVLALAAGSG